MQSTGNTDCIRLTCKPAQTRSKARAVLPCLQGVKRARRNRRHMGASPWQFVAESFSFFAADYFAAACRRSTQGDTKDIIILLRAQKSHFLQAPPICRKLSAKWGKVNARDFYNGVPLHIARRGKPRRLAQKARAVGFPSDHGISQAAACREIRELFS